MKMNSDMTKNTKPCLNIKYMMSAAMQFARQKVSPALRVPSFDMSSGAKMMPGVEPTDTIVCVMPSKLLLPN